MKNWWLWFIQTAVILMLICVNLVQTQTIATQREIIERQQKTMLEANEALKNANAAHDKLFEAIRSAEAEQRRLQAITKDVYAQAEKAIALGAECTKLAESQPIGAIRVMPEREKPPTFWLKVQ